MIKKKKKNATHANNFQHEMPMGNENNLKILFKPLTERIGHLVKTNKLLDSQHLRVVTSRSGIQPLDDGADVAKDAGVH